MNVFDPRFHAWLSRETGIDPASLGNDFVARALAERIAATQPGVDGGAAAQSGRSHQPITDEAVDAYWQRLNASPDERRALIELFVVPETWFFREREAFGALARLGAERLFAEPARVLRILSAPCSTGEEPYSAAMALLDAGIDPARFEIDALDISGRAIEHAERARYGRNSFRGHALAFRDRHFKAAADGWVLDERVRACVRFRRANLLDLLGCPGEPYDFVFCRNVLIYFDRDAQDRVVRIVEEQLGERGIVFVGPAETGVVMRQGLTSAQIPLAFAFHKAAAETTARPGVPAIGAPAAGGARRGGAVAATGVAGVAGAERTRTLGGTLRAIAHEWLVDAGWPTPGPIARAIDGEPAAFEPSAESFASAPNAVRPASEPLARAGDSGWPAARAFARAPSVAEPAGESFAPARDAGRSASAPPVNAFDTGWTAAGAFARAADDTAQTPGDSFAPAIDAAHSAAAPFARGASGAFDSLSTSAADTGWPAAEPIARDAAAAAPRASASLAHTFDTGWPASVPLASATGVAQPAFVPHASGASRIVGGVAGTDAASRASAEPYAGAPPEAPLDAARRLADAGAFDAAQQAVRASIDLSGPSADAFYLLGLIADAQGRGDEATDCYRKALYLEPSHYEALTHLATLLDIAGDRDGAQWLMQRARRAAQYESASSVTDTDDGEPRGTHGPRRR
ncbi:CheR family methyltransferase [Burkholderia oklahomensis]|uniref:CheR methyltransferase, SAM binding domain protein n=3 Tax=Burkholderia oklahomensis TaxID=342113 RepID=A0AAI8FQZ3_9BURK|nr:CheR family methyltransferase [Burkholderia oklahomensis]AIO69495.1 cheR methyltransferase, SAM binding domain protein [Burkholderia oklahomensis]AOI38539.1 chemotaxis protein CheR [Burkholderia oklahomensis EO147]KUY48340.1 chemotaxis protein CheR [Burkholderia oklahomensis EO147]QPS41109.1 chemotaxis protein CheR [Burkholderia oklahomensis]